MTDCLTEYFRCSERYIRFALDGAVPETDGYFRFGDVTLYGKYGRSALSPRDALVDASQATTLKNGRVLLPFDYGQVVDSLRFERYVQPPQAAALAFETALSDAYYFVRPLLPVAVRKYLQTFYLGGWRKIPFPGWPVDRTVDNLLERLLLLALDSSEVERIPFIWFWPEGATSCAIMTHDVETERGRDFCAKLMDIDDSFGIKASFQITPERRYQVTPAYLDSIRKRGFEIGVQDLNHDGHLYRDRQHFVSRVNKINAYGREWGVEGFRAAILYRRQQWFDALEFAYEMSVPSVAHLDPQRGGCCTVMPYFVGDILELPVTTTQDYSLFYILNSHSLDLWKQQIDLIHRHHGLMSFIVHPDYVIASREQTVFRSLLSYLAELRRGQNLWIATPGEVNRWWRQRTRMRIVEDSSGVRIEGEGHERARIAYASRTSGRLALTLEHEGVPA